MRRGNVLMDAPPVVKVDLAVPAAVKAVIAVQVNHLPMARKPRFLSTKEFPSKWCKMTKYSGLEMKAPSCTCILPG
jgi:hypothetical protein